MWLGVGKAAEAKNFGSSVPRDIGPWAPLVTDQSPDLMLVLKVEYRLYGVVVSQSSRVFARHILLALQVSISHTTEIMQGRQK